MKSMELPPPVVEEQKDRSTLIANIILVFLLLIAAGLGLYYYLQLQSKPSLTTSIESTDISTPTVTPTAVITPAIKYILPSGKQVYNFTHGPEVKGPKIKSVTINPLDPKVGTTQTIILVLSSVSPLSKATIIANTDTKRSDINLKFTGGDLSSGTYEGTWKVNDSFDNVYSLRYMLTDTSGTYNNTMYIR